MICKKCNVNKSKTFFSKSQLKKIKNNRKCKECSEEKFPIELEIKNQKVLFDNMIKWLLDNNAVFPSLEILHYNEQYRGIIVTKNIHKNQKIITIPHKCIMTNVKAFESDIGLELNKSGWDIKSSHTYMALMLLQEKLKPDSFWKPFIDILPDKYDNFPHFYKDIDLEQLKGSFSLDMIKSRNLMLKNEYNDLSLAIPSFIKKISLNDYIWARISVISRIFNIDCNNNNKVHGMVPMADMLNHSKEPGTKWSFFPNDDAFIVYSDKFIIKDKEVFDTYGNKCNSRYFVNYGFTLSNNNENNQAVLFIDSNKILSDKNDVSIEIKLKLFNTNATYIDDSFGDYKYLVESKNETLVSQDKQYRFQFNILTDKKVELNTPPITGLHGIWCLFGMFRLLLSSELEFSQLIFKVKDLNNNSIIKIFLSILPINVENELLVLQELSNICEKALTNFNTTIEMDEKELKDTPPYSNRWNILNMLIGEKTVLLYYRDLGIYTNHLWDEKKNIRKVGKGLKKHPKYSSYYNVYWEQLII